MNPKPKDPPEFHTYEVRSRKDLWICRSTILAMVIFLPIFFSVFISVTIPITSGCYLGGYDKSLGDSMGLQEHVVDIHFDRASMDSQPMVCKGMHPEIR